MSKENTNTQKSLIGPPEPTPQDKAKAIKWFDHARSVADKHNYDYAIECYLNGLGLWPEAVDEGHKPLRAVAFARLGTGGKKPGMFERMKFSSNPARDPLQGMITCEKFLARDPHNPDYLEGTFRNAHKAGFEQTCLWLGPILAEEALTNPKVHQAKLSVVHQAFEELGDRYNSRGELSVAVTCYQLATKALEGLARLKPDDAAIVDQLRNLSGKLTISKGKFESGDFRESLLDADLQRQMHDKDRMVQDDARMAELVELARRDLAAAPGDTTKVFALTDLLLRRGRTEDENEAIRVLVQAHEHSKIYQYKMRADEIRFRQLRRQGQELAAKGDHAAAADHLKKQLEFEIGIFLERIHQYPTDAHLKYELGKRYFLARRFDDAVPILQLARNDPKSRVACACLIAQCFYHKGYHDQAINLLQDTIKGYELAGNDASKELHYWLARSHEAAGHPDPAIQAYGQIIQWDYNYRDVRQRLEALQQGRKTANDHP